MVYLNYLETAHILGIPTKKPKEIFEKLLGYPPSLNSEISSDILGNHFGSIKSFDKRFDNHNKLDVYLKKNAVNYKKHIYVASKKGKFYGGKAVYNKIMTAEMTEHLLKCISLSTKNRRN